MEFTEFVPPEPIIGLLRRAAPGQSQRIESLFARLQPLILIDRFNAAILFRARLDKPNVITIGLECTRRLEAYAYVSALLAMASGQIHDSPERVRLYGLVDTLLNWAVPRDLHEALAKRIGEERSLSDIFAAASVELPEKFLPRLDKGARLLGRRFFELACAFILLHELGHLELRHTGREGADSIDQEKDADRFAAAWLLEDPAATPVDRLARALGISTALLWPTISNVYFGLRLSKTHPEPYDRLFHVLDQAIDPASQDESLALWELVSQVLFIHMDHVGFEFDECRMQECPREQANYLIDLLSRQRPSAG